MTLALDELTKYLSTATEKVQDKPKAFFLQRMGGMGDVIMALSAVHALRIQEPEAKIYLLTEPRYLPLTERCPHLDKAYTDPNAYSVAIQEHVFHKFNVIKKELGPVIFGVNRDHQVNAYLEALNHYAPPRQKTPVVTITDKDRQAAIAKLEGKLGPRINPRILLHPSRGDLNRTWPAKYWEELMEMILQKGQVPILVGDESSIPFKGVLPLTIPKGAISFINQLSFIETVVLCEVSDVFVSPDSGPVQIAGLTDIGIVGIYSTVPPRCRLPFRHGMSNWKAIGLESDCPNAGCYHLFLKDDSQYEKMLEAMRTDMLNPGCQATNSFMGDYCVEQDRYACMKQITPRKVWEACQTLLGVDWKQLESSFDRGCDAMTRESWAEAFEAVQECELRFFSPEFTYRKGIIQFQTGQWEAAMKTLSDLLKRAPGPEPLNLIGLIYFAHGSDEKAQTLFDMATTWNPAYLPAQVNAAFMRARAAHGRGDRLEGLFALEAFFKLHDLLDSEMDQYSIPANHGHVLKGYLLMDLSQLREARVAFEQAAELSPGSIEGSYGVAETFFLSGQDAQAIHWYKRVLKQDPTHQGASQRLQALGAAPK